MQRFFIFLKLKFFCIQKHQSQGGFRDNWQDYRSFLYVVSIFVGKTAKNGQ